MTNIDSDIKLGRLKRKEADNHGKKEKGFKEKENREKEKESVNAFHALCRRKTPHQSVGSFIFLSK